MQKESAGAGRISGGVGWSIEFNTQDCQHGWAVLKGGTGQSIGCYLTEEEAKKALEALAVTEPVIKNVKKCMVCGCDDIGNDHHYVSDTEKCINCIDKGQGPCWDGYEYAGTKDKDGKTVPNCIPVKKTLPEQEGIGAFNFWNGSFAPIIGSQMQDMRYNSTYNTPPQKDGKPSVGYGNRSDKQGRSNS